MNRISLFSVLLMVAFLGPALAQPSQISAVQESDNLQEMVEAVRPARSKKSDKQTVVSICDKILSRDVIADFMAHGTSPAEQAIRALKVSGELATRVEQWKEELEANPKSERLNFLLAIAAMQYCPEPESIGRPNVYPPVRIRITRQGNDVTVEAVDDNWNFEESAQIALPRKVLIGLAANSTEGILKEVTFHANGEQVSNPQWQPIQLGEDSTRGKVERSDEGIRLTGVGARPALHAADSNFFAFHEMDGDGSLEAIVESVSPDNGNGAVGIMIRGSLDPSAPFASIMLERREHMVRFTARKEQNESPAYLVALCGLRPHDPDFVIACLREMNHPINNMPGPAYQAAERLLEKAPNAVLKDTELFKEIYADSDHLDRFSKHLAVALSSSEGDSRQLAAAWLGMAHELQHSGNHEEAIALWDKVEALALDEPFPIEVHQERLISYKKLNRSDDAVKALKKLFLGPAEKGRAKPWMPTNSQRILDTVSLTDPALVPTITVSFHYAVQYNVAGEIAKALENSPGTPEQKASAKAVALALRIAAREPAVIASLKRDGAKFAVQLPKNLPMAGLAMIAFELQQFADGRAAASAVVERMLSQKEVASSSFHFKEHLLLWYLRLADFQKNPKLSEKAFNALVAHALASGENITSSIMSEAMQRLLQAGDVKKAAQVAAQYEKRKRRRTNDPFDKRAEVLGLLDLYQGNAVPMPIVWTNSLGDEAEVQWEFARDISKPMLQPEVRALGAPIPPLDNRYSLDLYAISSPRFLEIPEDAKIATLGKVESTGRWKGKISPSHRWIFAAFKDDEGIVHHSPPIPAVIGKNLVSPIQIDDVLNERGPWSTFTKSFWGTPLNTQFPKNSLFLSRYQPNLGVITFKHARVPIDPHGDYVFAAWMKTDNGQGEAGYRYRSDASVAVFFFDAEGKQVAEWGDVVRLGGSWTLLTGQFGATKGFGILPLPASATEAEVRVNLRSQCQIGDIGFYATPVNR